MEVVVGRTDKMVGKVRDILAMGDETQMQKPLVDLLWREARSCDFHPHISVWVRYMVEHCGWMIPLIWAVSETFTVRSARSLHNEWNERADFPYYNVRTMIDFYDHMPGMFPDLYGAGWFRFELEGHVTFSRGGGVVCMSAYGTPSIMDVDRAIGLGVMGSAVHQFHWNGNFCIELDERAHLIRISLRGGLALRRDINTNVGWVFACVPHTYRNFYELGKWYV